MKIPYKVAVVSLALVVFVSGLLGPEGAAFAATDPGLGAAASFSLLGQTAITDVPNSVISGNVGLNAAGTNYSGLTAGEVAGTIYASNVTGPATAILPPAVQADASTAYTTNIPGQGATASIGPILDGLTVVPGVYDIGAGRLNGGVLHLNGPGIYIFRASSDFVSSGSISLENGARACDVYWRVETLATINGSSFAGTILAGTGVHFGANVTLNGRALAIGGDVTLISDTISGPTCAATTPPSGGGGGGTFNPQPLISVTKIPNPLNLPSGPGLVTYNYAVSNIGVVAMGNIIITDNKCSNIIYVSGDVNGNSKLDLSEIWNYSCAATLSQTTTNTVTVTGESAANNIAIDTANATVIVGATVIPPLIHLVKKPNLFVLPFSGGAVTYTYTVTNPGAVSLSNVSVADNKCSPVSGLSGDTNNNNMLDTSETWTYTCRMNLAQTTTNTGTAEGHANGLTAIDFVQATVVVSTGQVLGTSTTGLPGAGSAPFPWYIALFTGITGIMAASLTIKALGKRNI